MYKKYVKRLLDIMFAIVGLIVLSPVIMTVAVLVRLRLGSPVIFRQPRPGLNEEIFIIYKFRTMTGELDSHGELLPDHIRLTPFGNFLRSTSLDELPELWNILKGDMSFVGPRPLLPEYLSRYSTEQRRRHEVRPGLTGLAQANGRNSIGWETRFRLDVQYVEDMSLLLDLSILVRTISAVFKREGIASETYVTMEDFQGESRGEMSIHDGI